MFVETKKKVYNEQWISKESNLFQRVEVHKKFNSNRWTILHKKNRSKVPELDDTDGIVEERQ